MHFLFTPIGSSGDVHPFLGTAIELQRRGHRITFFTTGYFRPLVESFGVDCIELGTAEEFLKIAAHPDLWRPTKAFPYLYRTGIEPLLPRQYAALAERFVPGETVAVGNCLGLGAINARDKLGLPLITLHLQPVVIWSRIAPPEFYGLFGPAWLRNWMYLLGERFVIDRTVCPSLNRVRRELGLPPVRHITRWWHSPDGVVAMFPQWYCPPQTDWPARLVQSGFPLWDERQVDQLPPHVESFLASGTPPIVFTPGSANMFGARFFEVAVAVCRQLGRRGILLTRFPEQIPEDLPEDVAYFPYVPFSQLLPRAAAVMHHGGIGSTSQGLAAGIPQLLMVLAHDQFDNAARIKRLGVGDSVTPSQMTASTVVSRLTKLLNDPEAHRNCQQWAVRMQENGGCPSAATAIESLAEDALQARRALRPVT